MVYIKGKVLLRFDLEKDCFEKFVECKVNSNYFRFYFL